MQSFDQAEIYSTYYPKVLRYITSHTNGSTYDAEDLAQTVFLKVYSKLDTFDGSKSSISTWIFNITRNTVIDHYRSRPVRLHSELPETLEDDSGDMLDDLIMEEELGSLTNALEKLSEEERDLIILRYYKQYTLLHISELMDRPYGQIKRLHAKALQNLSSYMK